MKKLNVKTSSRTDFVRITPMIQEAVTLSGIAQGICVVFVPHTTAAVTINEGADPDVMTDINRQLDKMVPWNAGYAHMEGNSAAHIKTSLFGSSEHIIIEGGKLQLGTWQQIYLCEFDGPRNRTVWVKVIGE